MGSSAEVGLIINPDFMEGKRHEDMIDHRSYIHNLSSCEIKAWKNSGLNGSNHSAIPVQCSTN